MPAAPRGPLRTGPAQAQWRPRKAERKAFQIASLLGHPPRLPLIILSELRLILSFFRRRGVADQFPALIEKVLEVRRQAEPLTAAE
jgi:hypothetical protein